LEIYICVLKSNTFNKINKWLASLGLELSIPKTQFILFHRSKNKIFPREMEVSESCIQKLNRVKYLGLVMASGLRWRDHLRELKSRKHLDILIF